MLSLSRGSDADSFCGGTALFSRRPARFVLAALEMFLKGDVVAKLRFLRDLDAMPGFTGTVFTQE